MAANMVDQILINGMTIGVSKGRCRLISFSANEKPGVMGTPIDYYKAHTVFGEGAMHVQCVP